MDSTDVIKCVEQANKKRTYNRKYYHNKTKPKRDQEREDMVILKEKCQDDNEMVQTIKDLKNEISILQKEN